METLALTVNREAVIAELEAISTRYEEALIAGQYERAGAMFWESPLARRFGVNEELQGKAEIAAFQSRRSFSLASREVLQRDILTLGDDVGVVTVTFTVEVDGQLRHGRQTQIWVRAQADGATWRVVSAHVSHRWPEAPALAFVDAAAARIGLPIAPDWRPGVAAAVESMANIAAPLLAFEPDDDLDPAGAFTP